MRVLLVSTYELGHQPLHVASPAAALQAAGHEVTTLDLSVQMWDTACIEGVDAVAMSVPMHTATRLALSAAAGMKAVRDVPVCLYGLYAHVAGGDASVDAVISGEYESGLVAWIDGLGAGGPGRPAVVDVGRGRAHLPVRSSLPPLDRYARLVMGDQELTAGYVEASHGCAHRCRHCPVPVVYDGRTRRVDAEIVLADIETQVGAGARHITFGDPDFLNRWAHSMQIVSEMHERFPNVTYDVTTKVEHLLKHADLVGDLASTGCVFVVSAFECTNDRILALLDKGHTNAEASRAIAVLRGAGIEPRPSWLPFTPWTTVFDVVDLLGFIAEHDLVGNVDPVQYSIRLLIPPNSLMLDIPEIAPYLGDYDPSTLSYSWSPADERTVALQQRIAALVEQRQADAAPIAEIYCDVRDEVHLTAGIPLADRDSVLAAAVEGRPRLTEAWFCCAEPTTEQFAPLTKGSR